LCDFIPYCYGDAKLVSICQQCAELLVKVSLSYIAPNFNLNSFHNCHIFFLSIPVTTVCWWYNIYVQESFQQVICVSGWCLTFILIHHKEIHKIDTSVPFIVSLSIAAVTGYPSSCRCCVINLPGSWT